MEQWFAIWGDNLITTSNLALNRAWLARLPVIQTGDEFITSENLDYCLTLHQFPTSDLCSIACRKDDLALLKRALSLCEIDHHAVKYAFYYGSLELINQVIAEANLDPVGLGRVIRLGQKRAAKLGRRDVIQWAVDRQWTDGIEIGAAKHSAELLKWVFELAPELKKRSAKLTKAALRSDAITYLIKERLTVASADQYPICIKYGRYSLGTLINKLGYQPSTDCTWAAAKRGLATLQEVCQYVPPTKYTLYHAAKAGDKESLLWLKDKCDCAMAMIGASQHSIAMMNFVQQNGFPVVELTPSWIEMTVEITLEIVQWAERCNYPIDYESVLFYALFNRQPKLVNHIREKTKLDDWHLHAALLSKNFFQAQWLLDHDCPIGDIIGTLSDHYDLETWQFARQRNLYPVPIDAPRWFDVCAPQILEWLRQTGQLNYSSLVSDQDDSLSNKLGS